MTTSKTFSSNPFPRISIAQVEGTSRSFRHRQNQLQCVQSLLAKGKGLLLQTLGEDYGFTETEALFEYSLSLSELRCHYGSLDLERELKTGSSIELGVENATRAVAAGVVYVLPQTGIYSMLSPFASAIAAGNCVIVEVPQTTIRTKSALRDMLLEGLSHDTFAIAKERPSPDFLRQRVVVLQSDSDVDLKGNSGFLSVKKLITSPSAGRNFAFIDQTADSKLAAQCMIEAAFAFNATSSYAPDVVFVHEAVEKSFSECLVQLANTSFASVDGAERVSDRGTSLERNLLAKLREFPTTDLLFSSPKGSIINVGDSSHQLLGPRFKYASPIPTLIISRFTSMDDAIGLTTEITDSNDIGLRWSQNPMAAFIFARPREAQYLANSVNATFACVNTFPVQLLIGPRRPVQTRKTAGGMPLSPRYTREMFEELISIVLRPSPDLQLIGDGVTAAEGSARRRFKQWANSTVLPLRPTGQRNGEKVDFFAMAIMIGAVAAGIPVLVTAGFLGNFILGRLR